MAFYGSQEMEFEFDICTKASYLSVPHLAVVLSVAWCLLLFYLVKLQLFLTLFQQNRIMKSELNSLRVKHSELLEELHTYKDKVGGHNNDNI